MKPIEHNSDKKRFINCPICGESINHYLFVIHHFTVVRCPGCGVISNVLTENEKKYIEFGVDGYFSTGEGRFWTDSITEQDAIDGYLKLLEQNGVSKNNKILLIAPYSHMFKSRAGIAGWLDIQQETLESFDQQNIQQKFDAIVILYQLEKSINPGKFLNKIHSLLNPNGKMILITISLESTSSKFFGQFWTEWRAENHFYFNPITIQLLLWHSCFGKIKIKKDRRKYTLSHIYDRAKAFPRTWITQAIKFLYNIVPGFLRNWRLRLPSSGMIVVCERTELRKEQVCSIVIPVYNEGGTFTALMDAVLVKQLPSGIRKEIIIVESNSTDGTREQVLQYQDRPEVKIILQEKAMGKGNAVRAGFDAAKGDILFIQDADLEYDLNDLDTLLEPITRYQVPFVLGSRRGGKWKMREFNNDKGLSTYFNFGHNLFSTILNLLYGQHMKDPFTMYKIFRRDCIYGLKFDSNRFDFDFELVIKLVRKGYTPQEIPVNYRSRSYSEGKKVRVFRDPLTWIWALIKYRFEKI